MKKILILCLTMVAMGFTTKAQSTFDIWPELKAYHTLMSASFHPAEEGNLDPIKKNSAELAEKSNLLLNSLIPQEFDNPAIKVSVKKLAAESRALHQLIKKNGKDVVILKNLTALHDRFHEIIGLCKEEKH